MGINVSRRSLFSSYQAFRKESRAFLSSDKGSIQHVLESSPLYSNPFQIKQKSSIQGNLDSKLVEEIGLELYSNLLSYNNKLNEAMYHPISTLKLNSTKDTLDFIKFQAEYLNDWLKSFEVSNKLKIEEIEARVSSIKTNSEPTSQKDDSLLINDNALLNIYNETNEFEVAKSKTFFSTNNKAKGEDAKTVTSLLNQLSFKGKPNSFEGNNLSLSRSKNISKGGESEGIKILKCRTNPPKLAKYTSLPQNKAKKESETKYTNFINNVIDKLPDLIQNDQPEEPESILKKNAEAQVKKKKLNYDFDIRIIETQQKPEASKVLPAEKKKENLHKCKKYFKLKREIEEEKLLKRFKKQKKKMKYKIHIDLRSLPNEIEERMDSSNFSNENEIILDGQKS